MKYTVHLMTPYYTWEDVVAKSKKDAIKKCEAEVGREFDWQEPNIFVVSKDEEEDRNEN